MTVSTFVQPNYNTQSGTAYPLSIDAAFAAFLRLAGTFAPHEQSTPNMTVRLDAGHVFNGTALTESAPQSTGTITAPSTNPRKDIVYIDRLTGAVGVATGAEAASPADPAIPAGTVPVARVTLATSTTAITNSMLDDLRSLNLLGLASGATTTVGTAAARNAAAGSGDLLPANGDGSGLTGIATTPRSYLAGYKLANNAGDATNDIDIFPGVARDTADTATLTLATALTKQLDAAWAVGSAAGMRDTGSIANGTWHIHAVRRPDTGVVDALASLAADEVGTFTVTIGSPAVVTETNHGRVNGASVVLSTTGALPTGLTAGTLYYVVSAAADTYSLSATQGGAAINTSGSQSGVHTAKGTPVLPANYTQFRRIGSIIRSGATILAFVQTGDEFLFNAVTLDITATNPGTSAVLRTLVVPTGIAVGAVFNWNMANAGGADYARPRFSSPLVSDQAPSASAAPLLDGGGLIAGNGASWPGWKFVTTNKSAQVRSRLTYSDGNVTLYMATIGWFDRRGRDA